MKKECWVMLAGLLVFMQTSIAASQAVTGAGSSAAAPIYESWARGYQKASGVGVQYESIGSSAGMKKIRAREAGFGASDVAPSDAELRKDGLVVFPIAITGIAPVVNIPKVGDGQLRLSGWVLARIFMGEIAQWNDPEIVQLNPGIKLPDLPVKVVVRSDGSGTTYNFADYLAKISPAWKGKYGVKTSITWPAGFLGAKGSEGVVKAVKLTTGSIGYVDFGYVKDNKLSAVQLKNSEDEFLMPSIDAFRDALANSEWVSKGTFTSTLTNKPGKGAWPITMGTFALVPQVTDKVDETLRALKFFVWAFLNGDTLVQENNFVRLPNRVQASAFGAIATVKDKEGKLIGLNLVGDTIQNR
jgi:phosphate transport system substrate-binding protein